MQVKQAYKSPAGREQAVEIPLSQGYVTRIDAADRVFTDGHSWRALVNPRRKVIYACTEIYRETILLHVLLCPGWTEVDHADGDGLNNCRSNLRDGSGFRNKANRGLLSTNRSGFKGVSWRRGKWLAQIQVARKGIFLGYFGNPEEAAYAYDQAAISLFGEYAKTNAMLGRATREGPSRPPVKGRPCPPGCTCGRHRRAE